MKSAYENVNTALEQFVKSVQGTSKLEDASVAIRVVGEFSSGKTRFVSELFSSMLPAELKPVSSLARETVVPLEITYGENVALELIRRTEDDGRAELIKSFSKFPRRKELAGIDLENCRLRLFVPEERLTLAKGDGIYANEPQRLRIIDHPGWNSGDEKNGGEGMGLSADWKNMALVYVCKLKRLDSADNYAMLAEFIKSLKTEMDLTLDKLPLFVLITDCPEEERAIAEERLKERILEMLGKFADEIPLCVRAVDFSKMSAEEKQALFASFWQHVLEASPSEPIKKNALRAMTDSWKDEWKLRPYLRKCLDYLDEAGKLVSALRPDGKFMGGREMSFYEGLKNPELSSRILNEFSRRNATVSENSLKALQPPDLPKDHPLRPWLDAYWLPRLREPVDAMRDFNQAAKKAIRSINPAITDLEEYLSEKLDAAYRKAARPYPISFVNLCRLCRGMNDLPEHTLLATLLGASLLEARYADSSAAYRRN